MKYYLKTETIQIKRNYGALPAATMKMSSSFLHSIIHSYCEMEIY